MEPNRNWNPPTHAMKGLRDRHRLKYNRIKDFPLRAWSRQPMICRAQPKLGSSYTRHERPGSPSPVEIQRNQRYSIMAAWSRQLMICRAQPKLVSSYTCNERLGGPSPSEIQQNQRFSVAGMVPPADDLSSPAEIGILLHTP